MFIDTEEFMVTLVMHGLALPAEQVSTEMPADPPLPFVLVTRVAASDDKITEDATCSVSVFANSRVSASDVARRLHWYLLNITPQTEVALSTGVVSVDSIATLSGPAWVSYDDEDLERFVARYEIASRFNSQPLT